MRIAAKALLAIAGTFALFWAIGYRMPYPDILAPAFGMWAGQHEDAVMLEQLAEFAAIAVTLVFGGDWLFRRFRPSN